VRNCYPLGSVYIVEKIIAEFKNSNRDVADFRIKMKANIFLYVIMQCETIQVNTKEF